jgi:hypothetical protein
MFVHLENDALRRPHEAPAIEIDPTEPDQGQRAPVGKVRVTRCRDSSVKMAQ